MYILAWARHLFSLVLKFKLPRAEQDFDTVPFKSRTIEKTFSPFKPRMAEIKDWYIENLNES